MGRYSFAGPGVQIYNIAPITFEPYSLASQGAYLCTGSHHVDDPNFQLFAKPITLKRRAWIAAEAFVGPGVVVHEGAVLGARGCTTKDLDAWTIYAGNPAKKIRMRNLDATAFQESN
jgi:putative colanic acid biosynthesis acetyltransferase WcaF